MMSTKRKNSAKRLLITVLCGVVIWPAISKAKKRPPNVVIIFTDDQGYGDVGVFGARGFSTPHIDKMAAEGMKFTDFYVASSVCSPSRAALLTGSYPQRIGIPGVLFPERRNTNWDPEKRNTKTGIHPDETTLPEMLKANGYATGAFGKWHLGHHRKFLPLQQGFDEYYGLPYSNDMRPGKKKNKQSYPPLPLMNGNKVERFMEDDQSMLTTVYTEKAVDFIKRHKDEPFFVYLPHTMPHIPLYVSEKFAGHSENGIYGDVIEEIDWSVGQINKTLKELGLEENTLVIFTTDNGPWLVFGDHGGSAGSLREGKFTTFEGGQRVPCVMKWPNTIPAGSTTDQIVSTIDLLPTIAAITGSDLPKKKIDGQNMTRVLKGYRGNKMLKDEFFYYRGWNLEAVRSGKWKLHVPHTYNQVVVSDSGNVHGRKGMKSEIGLALFDLSVDVGEQHNVAGEHPEIVEKMLKRIENMKARLGDSESTGEEKRDCGWQLTEAEWPPQ